MKEKKYLVLGITLVLLTFVGVSLAYFLTTIEGDRKNITINTADLRVIFTNGDAIEGTEIEPGWSVTKTFSVENKTKNEYKYNIVIEDLLNTFKTTGYLQYKITSTDGGYNMTDFEDVPKSSNATDTVLAYSVSIPSKSTQNYTITIQYKNDENVDQSIDSLNNAVVTGNIYISKGTPMPTLTEAILRDNPTISERIDFNVANTTNTTGTIYQTNKTEDGSTVYYYSGNTTNNWIKFGKHPEYICTYNGERIPIGLYDGGNEKILSTRPVESESECSATNICVTSAFGPVIGVRQSDCSDDGGSWITASPKYEGVKLLDIYWRIIRTNEDGSARLLYTGTSPDTTNGHIGESRFDGYGNLMYVGYMYGTSGSLENNRTNTNDSTIKKYIDTWYEKNLLTSYDKYISKDAIYCNDRSIPDNNYSTSNDFNYGSYTRLVANKIPSYKCGANTSNGLFETTQAVADKFSASTAGGGNGQLKYPIALMTADEVAYAGGLYGLSNTSAWYNTNSIGESIIEDPWRGWWLLSPVIHRNPNGSVWQVTNSTYFSYLNVWNNYLVVRPAISLASCVKVNGAGTSDNPYKVDYDNSCK